MHASIRDVHMLVFAYLDVMSVLLFQCFPCIEECFVEALATEKYLWSRQEPDLLQFAK